MVLFSAFLLLIFFVFHVAWISIYVSDRASVSGLCLLCLDSSCNSTNNIQRTLLHAQKYSRPSRCFTSHIHSPKTKQHLSSIQDTKDYLTFSPKIGIYIVKDNIQKHCSMHVFSSVVNNRRVPNDVTKLYKVHKEFTVLTLNCCSTQTPESLMHLKPGRSEVCLNNLRCWWQHVKAIPHDCSFTRHFTSCFSTMVRKWVVWIV